MRTYYCQICGEWFRAKAQIDTGHYHQAYEPAFMLCKPAGLKYGSSYVGVKPLYRNGKVKKWRAMLIYIESGYSQTPSWGHEAGGWIHYTYESMKDQNGYYIESHSEQSLVSLLSSIKGVEPDSYFK